MHIRKAIVSHQRGIIIVEVNNNVIKEDKLNVFYNEDGTIDASLSEILVGLYSESIGNYQDFIKPLWNYDTSCWCEGLTAEELDTIAAYNLAQQIESDKVKSVKSEDIKSLDNHMNQKMATNSLELLKMLATASGVNYNE